MQLATTTMIIYKDTNNNECNVHCMAHIEECAGSLEE